MTIFAMGEFIYLELSHVFAPLLCLSLSIFSMCVSVSLSFSPHLFISPPSISLLVSLSLSLPLSLYIGPDMGDKIYQEATELEEKQKKENEEANPDAYVFHARLASCYLWLVHAIQISGCGIDDWLSTARRAARNRFKVEGRRRRMTKFLAGSDQLEEDEILEARRETSRLVKVKEAELTPVSHVRLRASTTQPHMQPCGLLECLANCEKPLDGRPRLSAWRTISHVLLIGSLSATRWA
jgi:hypothetical protein